MNWKQRGLAAVGAVVFTAGFIAMPAVAAVPKVGVGTVSNCKISGTVKFNPPLKNASAIVTTTINTTIACNGGTGDGLTIKSGTAVATEKKSQNCGGLAGTTAHKIYISAKWVAKPGKPALANSNGTLTKVTTKVSAAGGITFDATGKITAGSFSKVPANDVLAHAIIKENLSAVLTLCGKTGVKQLTIQPTSALTIN